MCLFQFPYIDRFHWWLPFSSPGWEVSMASTSCFIFRSGQAELRAEAAVLLAAGWVGEATVLAIEAGTGGVTAMAAGRAERMLEGWEGGTGPGVASMVGMAWARCWACEACCSPPWEGSASTVAMTGGATAMWTSALGFTLRKRESLRLRTCIRNSNDRMLTGMEVLWSQWQRTHPAGRGDPAPRIPLSILPLPGSLGWAGIRFLRTQLKHKERQGLFD